MSKQSRAVIKSVAACIMAASIVLSSTSVSLAVPMARALRPFTPVAEPAKAPNPWAAFCKRNPDDCRVEATAAAREIELTDDVWDAIVGANNWVNKNITHKTDQKHFGVLDRWDYPMDGYGDCEDFALLKRRILIEVGIPREALLITVVWTKQNNGHAVLMVRTNKGEYILDNLNKKVLLWSQTGHDFVKRQTQTNPNEWVYIDREPKAPAVAVTKPAPQKTAKAQASDNASAPETITNSVAAERAHSEMTDMRPY
jgi:predicted transglutaminase-like cysteine proteinase